MIPVDTLPDEVLLAAFDFVVDEDAKTTAEVEAWKSLVHVCRRWRSIVFGSPRRLNLRLVCEIETPIRDTLDVWPPLLLVIWGSVYQINVDIIIAQLEHSDRLCQIYLYGGDNLPMETVLAAMQQPFPELTDLVITMLSDTVTALPDSFLGGSAPRLRKLHLAGIPFPGLPKLLLSATHLVDLLLCNIPYSGYISPEAMATALSTLTSLQLFGLMFLFIPSLPNWAHRPSPPTCSLLPVLETLRFEGATEYLDDLVACIDVPRLSSLDVAFSTLSVHDAPQFAQLISRTSTFEVLNIAHVIFKVQSAWVRLSSETPGYSLIVRIRDGGLDKQLWSLQQVFTLWLPPLSTASSSDLHLYENIDLQLDWPEDDIEDMWLELLRSFTSVKNLYLSKEIASRIVPALQQLVGDRTTEVLPALEKIFLKEWPQGPVQKGIGEFIAGRRLSGHHIAVSLFSEWERDMEDPWDIRNLELEGFDEW